MIEDGLEIKLDPHSFMFERFTAHLRYLLVRIRDQEPVRLDMDEYARTQFPGSYRLAEEVCQMMAEPISWAPDLILKGDGFEGDYYKKE